MKKIIIIINFFILINMPGFSDEVEFPGKLHFEVINKLIIRDSSYSNFIDHGRFNVECLGFYNEITGAIDFNIKGFYTIKPWLKNKFKVYNKEGLVFKDKLFVGLNNTFSIKKIMFIGINPEIETIYELRSNIDLIIRPVLKLNGGDYNIGLSWLIQQGFALKFNPELYDNNDPQLTKIGFFDSFVSETLIKLDFEIFHFFAPEYIKCTLHSEDEMFFLVPYGWGEEKQKRLTHEVLAGFKFQFWNISSGIYLWFKTRDFYYESAPIDGHMGSENEWNTINPVHSQPGMLLGLRLNFEFSKKWLSLGIEYTGYSEVRASDIENNYDTEEYNYWKNKIDIWVKISL